MPTILAQDQQALQNLCADRTELDALGKPLGSTVTMKEPGKITFAGNLWPNLTTPTGKQTKSDVETALTEARSMVFRGLQTARAALRGDQTAVALMTLWFGARPVGPADDWWLGVEAILTRLNRSLTADINVHYRGADALGKPNDYPGRGTAPLTAHDVSGYAETYRSQQDLVIGLCRVFFNRDVKHKARTIKLKGFDSVGGVLVHEMSHNLCGTLDHTTATGQTYYGVLPCQGLATNLPRQAWYNADNIEYFCEEALYGQVQPPVAVQGGNVSALKAQHEQAIVDANH